MTLWFAAVRFDDRIIDPAAVESLATGWRERAPGGCAFHTAANVAMATGALTPGERPHARGIGKKGIWVVADARLDDRETLIASLRAQGERVDAGSLDTELLRAGYRVWRTELPRHLIGDFGFALWDEGEHRLLCARDPFGVRPVYYHQDAGGVVVSNDLACLRRIAEVDDDLDEAAIGDFLLFQMDLAPTRTSTKAVQRIPPAHLGTWTAGDRTHRRYWNLPIEPPVHDPEFCVDGFRETLDRAVADRMRQQRISISMSGGLDSTTLAAISCRLARRAGHPENVRGLTIAYRRLIDDREEHFARLTAESLALAHDVVPADDHRLFADWNDLRVAPDPSDLSLSSLAVAADRRAADHSPWSLTGLGGDLAFYPHTRYAAEQLRRGRLDRVLRYFVLGWWTTRRRPPLGVFTTSRRLRNHYRADADFRRMTGLLNPSFVARQELEERWRQITESRGSLPDEHPWRPQAFRLYQDPYWPATFERLAHPARHVPSEQSHPFFDPRVVRHALRLPAVPWCLDKHVVRRMMEGHLPAPVVRRRKTPLGPPPPSPLARPASTLWSDAAGRHPELSQIFGDGAVRAEYASPGHAPLATRWISQQPLHLARWLDRTRLQSRPRVRLYSPR